jgi:hypothetical protein
MPTSFCYRFVPERRGLWMTIDNPITSPQQVSFVFQYPNTDPAYAGVGGLAGFVVRFYVAGIP